MDEKAILPDCHCAFENTESKKCEVCSERCAECKDKITNCVKCAKDHFVLPECTACEPGYFLSGEECLKCGPRCETCKDSESNCLTCAVNREGVPECKCRVGFL